MLNIDVQNNNKKTISIKKKWNSPNLVETLF